MSGGPIPTGTRPQRGRVVVGGDRASAAEQAGGHGHVRGAVRTGTCRCAGCAVVGAIAHPALSELGGRWGQGHVRGAVRTGTCRCAGCAVVGAIAHPALSELGGRWGQGHVRGAVRTGTCRCAGCAVVGAIAHPALSELGGRWGQGHVRGRFTRGRARTPGCAVAGGDRAPAANVPACGRHTTSLVETPAAGLDDQRTSRWEPRAHRSSKPPSSRRWTRRGGPPSAGLTCVRRSPSQALLAMTKTTGGAISASARKMWTWLV